MFYYSCMFLHLVESTWCMMRFCNSRKSRNSYVSCLLFGGGEYNRALFEIPYTALFLKGTFRVQGTLKISYKAHWKFAYASGSQDNTIKLWKADGTLL